MEYDCFYFHTSEEMRYIGRTAYLSSMTGIIMFFGRHLLFYPILLSLVFSKQGLRAPALYITLACLNNLRKDTLKHMTNGVRSTMQLSVSISRSQVYLDKRHF